MTERSMPVHSLCQYVTGVRNAERACPSLLAYSERLTRRTVLRQLVNIESSRADWDEIGALCNENIM